MSPPSQINSEQIETIITRFNTTHTATKLTNLLPILHAIQKEFHHIPEQSLSLIAKALQTTSAEIYGVVSFYHQFKLTPSGKNRVQICLAEACQARGSSSLEKHAKQLLNIDFNQTTADDNISLDAVYCLGNCATGPNIRVNDRLYGKVTQQKFSNIIHSINKEQT